MWFRPALTDSSGVSIASAVLFLLVRWGFPDGSLPCLSIVNTWVCFPSLLRWVVNLVCFWVVGVFVFCHSLTSSILNGNGSGILSQPGHAQLRHPHDDGRFHLQAYDLSVFSLLSKFSITFWVVMESTDVQPRERPTKSITPVLVLWHSLLCSQYL